jgi:D-alanine-D-alanine ligase-like ATP-grasp enzyme
LNLTVVRESWRPHPLSWIHRAEARALTDELRRAGYTVASARFRNDAIFDLPSGPLLLRLSDPVMFAAVRALGRAGRPFIGPRAAIMERCYDKYEACRIARSNGIECPTTALASGADGMPLPLVLKPRRGSDSIGVRILRGGRIPAHWRSDDNLVQQYVHGAELTVALLRGRVGMPLRIFLPEGAPYSFARKYLWRPPRAPLGENALTERVRAEAAAIAHAFGVDWAARIDLIHETATARLCFLECDVAPLIGAGSAFAASLTAGGIARAEQLRLLLHESGAGA